MPPDLIILTLHYSLKNKSPQTPKNNSISHINKLSDLFQEYVCGHNTHTAKFIESKCLDIAETLLICLKLKDADVISGKATINLYIFAM